MEPCANVRTLIRAWGPASAFCGRIRSPGYVCDLCCILKQCVYIQAAVVRRHIGAKEMSKFHINRIAGM